MATITLKTFKIVFVFITIVFYLSLTVLRVSYKGNLKLKELINPEVSLSFFSFTNPEVRRSKKGKHSKMGKVTGKDHKTG